MAVRWTKILRDLWNNRARTGLVILSIAVGVFAIGMIAATRQSLTESVSAQYAALRPADAIIETEPALTDDFVSAVRHMRGVSDAEGRRRLPLRISLDGEGKTWRDLTLYALPDYDDQRLLYVRRQDGSWPPEKREVLLERSSMAYIGAQPGETILVKTAEGKQYRLQVTGRAHDLYRVPPMMEGWIYGYVSLDTLRWLGQAEGYNELYVEVEPGADLQALTDKVADRVEGEGLPVYEKTLPDPGKHPLSYIIDTLLILLGLVAVLSMFLSALLVVNVISALIAQQEKQIGIMKAVGAKSGQIIVLYFGMVLLIGLVACLIAIPFSRLGAQALTSFVAEMLNFDPPVVDFSAEGLLLQFGTGLLLPLLASAPAVFHVTRVSPARVLSEYGINQVWGGAGLIDSLLRRFPLRYLRLSRTSLLALRGPFRKRGRLALSLVTLIFAGAVFMAIVNLQFSLNEALNQMLGFWGYDAWLIVDGHVPTRRLVDEARTVPGVGQAEGWGFTIGRSVRADGSESDDLYLLAPPAESKLLHPPIIAGRGLLPGETNGILVSPGLLTREPELRLGGEMKVKIEGLEETYTIVGVMQMMGNSTIGYFTVMDYEGYTRHVREPNRSNAIILTIPEPGLEAQRRVASQVEQQYDRAGLRVLSNFLIAEERQEIDAAFLIIVALLMVMTGVLAAVGGLGLMGTMSLNVIERTREIGVMRAYGASSAAVFRIFILEGLLIGLISWGLAILLSLPLSVLLARTIGMSFMDYPMPASISFTGILGWAAMVVVISVIASFLPALSAVRLTVTQVLAYE